MIPRPGPGGRPLALDYAPRKLPKLGFFLPKYKLFLTEYKFVLTEYQFVLPNAAW